ncbi:hypothetical protein chiPu_0018250 [Chiloscyllium punctatum]|uniref:Ig-like domain-containing protein n=1 Tax=Chiloscyllium punctatum TaxID=137246 RepID=A0A401RM27_CHIPU|nr:hypothetical protein [Chiloscyllium punctatum]
MFLSSMYNNIIPSVLAFWIQTTVTGLEVLINVNSTAVEFGGAIEMNCSTTCPKPTINVEHKPGVNFIRTKGITWYHDYFPSVQKWDLTLACSVKCLDPQPKDVKEYVTVYNREISITLLPEVLEINRTYSLECIGPRVYPNNKLILTWLRGSEILQRNSTGEPGSVDEDKRLRNVFNFIASRSDDGQEYTCLAEVDLGSQTTKSITNSSITLQTYAFSSPEIQVPTSQEGNLVNITCRVLNVSGDLELRLKNGNDILVNGSSSTGLTISHTVEAQAKLDGQQYICEAELKLQDQSMTSPVIKQQVGTLHVLYQTTARRLAAKIIGLSSVVIIAGELLFITIIYCIKQNKKK